MCGTFERCLLSVSDPSVADFAFGERHDAPWSAPLPIQRNGQEGVTRWAYARRYLPENEVIPLSEVEALLLSERAQLWCGEACAGVTEVTEDGRLHMMLAGGSM